MANMKKVLINTGKALCYALSLVLSQLAVIFAANVVFVIKLGMQSYGPYGTLPPFEEMLNAALDFSMENAALLAGLGDLLAIFLLWLFFRLRRKKLCFECGFSPLKSEYPWPVVISGLSLALAVSFAINMLPIPQSVMEEYMEASSSTFSNNILIMLVAVVLIGPFAEELVFRGLVYSRLRRAVPVWAAAVLSSLVFALTHGVSLWIAYAFIMGLAMAFIYEKTGSLWGSIIFHICFNFSGSFLYALFAYLDYSAAICVCAACFALGIYMLFLIGKNLKKQPDEENPA